MKKPTVLLINPWIADFAAYDLWSKPLGLLYIGKFLRHYGYNLQLIDLTDRLKWGGAKPTKEIGSRGKYHKTIIPKPPALASVPRKYGLYGATPEQFQAALQEVEPPQLIFVTSHMAYWYPGIVETVRILRNTYPGAKIVLGGSYATLFPEHARRTVAPDYLITGYGEKAALKLADEIFGIKRNYNTIPDTYDAGVPPWDLYPKLSVATVLTSRGCPMHCDYCATPLLNPNLLQRSPNDVIGEIDYLYHHHNIREFAFYDDALFTDKDRHIVPILTGIIERDLQAIFQTPNGLFAREIDQNLADLMKAAEFQTIRLSLESIIPDIQKMSTNKVNTGNFEAALDNLERAGFSRSHIDVYLIMGLPGQKYLDVEKSLQYVHKQGVISRLASYSPIPGTPHWEIAKKAGLVRDHMDPLLTNNTLYPGATLDFPVEQFTRLRQISSNYNADIRKNREG